MRGSRGGKRGIRGKKFAKASSRTMEMGLGVSDGPIEHGGNFRMLVALNVVEDNDKLLRRAKAGEGAFEIKAIERRGKLRIGTRELRGKARGFVVSVG